MAAKRRSLTPKQKAEVRERQGNRCVFCGKEFCNDDKIEYDHIQALARGGTNELSNFRALHKDPCHKLVTFGRKHYRLGSDLFEIAKTKRLVRKQKPKPKKAKIPSRGFDKRYKRKMDGTVEKRESEE